MTISAGRKYEEIFSCLSGRCGDPVRFANPLRATRYRHREKSFNVRFRADFFNALNRANFASPTGNLAAFDQSGSSIPCVCLIDSTQTT